MTEVVRASVAPTIFFSLMARKSYNGRCVAGVQAETRGCADRDLMRIDPCMGWFMLHDRDETPYKSRLYCKAVWCGSINIEFQYIPA